MMQFCIFLIVTFQLGLKVASSNGQSGKSPRIPSLQLDLQAPLNQNAWMEKADVT